MSLERHGFDSIYSGHAAGVRAYLTVALSDAQDAEDVTQEVFARVFQALPRYVATGQPVEHWLFAIARRCAISHHRKRGRRTVPMSPAQIDAQCEGVDGDGSLEWGAIAALHASLDALPSPHREVVVLSYYGGLDTGEVATALGLSRAHVRQLKRRALARLRLDLASPAPRPLGDPPTGLPSGSSPRTRDPAPARSTGHDPPGPVQPRARVRSSRAARSER